MCQRIESTERGMNRGHSIFDDIDENAGYPAADNSFFATLRDAEKSSAFFDYLRDKKLSAEFYYSLKYLEANDNFALLDVRLSHAMNTLLSMDAVVLWREEQDLLEARLPVPMDEIEEFLIGNIMKPAK